MSDKLFFEVSFITMLPQSYKCDLGAWQPAYTYNGCRYPVVM